MKFIIIACLFLGLSSHDIQVTLYKITLEGDEMSIEFFMENDDINSTLNELNVTRTDESLQEYINNHFSVQINGVTRSISFTPGQVVGNHTRLRGVISQPDQKINSIDIKNTCMLNIAGHSNIIQLRLYDQERDFLMNEDRTTLQVNY